MRVTRNQARDRLSNDRRETRWAKEGLPAMKERASDVACVNAGQLINLGWSVRSTQLEQRDFGWGRQPSLCPIASQGEDPRVCRRIIDECILICVHDGGTIHDAKRSRSSTVNAEVHCNLALRSLETWDSE